MKKYLVFSLIFFAKFALSQVNDNFDDGNFTSNPVWTGSNSSNDFVVASSQLRSNSTTANANFYISTANSLASNCVWEFYCNLQFNTSGANYIDVYLTSDQLNLQAANINGYFVRIGNTNDEICLYKRSGAASTSVKIIDGIDASVSSSTNNKINIRVTRTDANVFTLERDITGTGASFVSEGSVTDASFTTSAYFGIFIQQSTSGFHQKHFFDDISIRPIVVDLIPPKVVALNVLSETALEVVFDEPVDEATAKTINNYNFNNPLSIASVNAGTDASRIVLTLTNPIKTGAYTLTVSNVKDKSNNVISAGNTTSFNYVQPYFAKKGDVVINEIFADPSPQVDLPGVEFIELWNTSKETISLQNWKYSDPSSTAILPNYSLKPDDYLILCAKADTSEFKVFGKVVGISPWPSLNNSGDVLKLVNSQGVIVDSVAYKDSWYKDTEKKVGGWSLEMIDEKATCKGAQNWLSSNDVSGGTPGRKNSIYHINNSSLPLAVASARLKDSVTINVEFNRFIDSLSASNASNYSINNGLGKPVSVKVTSPEFNTAELKFSNVIGRGKTYKVTVSDVTDCSGVLMTTNNSAEFSYPDKIQSSNILVSEILFNPKPDGVDFVEIYNSTGKDLDLQELSLATI